MQAWNFEAVDHSTLPFREPVRGGDTLVFLGYLCAAGFGLRCIGLQVLCGPPPLRFRRRVVTLDPWQEHWTGTHSAAWAARIGAARGARIRAHR